LALWTAGCFREILSDVGTLVEVDEATSNWECIEYTRLKVRLVVASTVKFSKDFLFNDRVYKVSVEEEHSFKEVYKFSSWFNGGDVNDSHSSVDTKVGETIHSGDFGWEMKEDERSTEEEKEGCRNHCLSGGWDKQVVEEIQCQTNVPKIFNAGDSRLITTDGSVNMGSRLEVELWGAQRVEEFYPPSISGQLFNADVNWLVRGVFLVLSRVSLVKVQL